MPEDKNVTGEWQLQCKHTNCVCFSGMRNKKSETQKYSALLGWPEVLEGAFSCVLRGGAGDSLCFHFVQPPKISSSKDNILYSEHDTMMYCLFAFNCSDQNAADAELCPEKSSLFGYLRGM